MIKVWILVTMMFGTPVPLTNSPEFKHEWLCERQLKQMGPAAETFKVVCAELQKEEQETHEKIPESDTPSRG